MVTKSFGTSKQTSSKLVLFGYQTFGITERSVFGCSLYSRHPKSERSDFGAFHNRSLSKQFRFQTKSRQLEFRQLLVSETGWAQLSKIRKHFNAIKLLKSSFPSGFCTLHRPDFCHFLNAGHTVNQTQTSGPKSVY